MGMRGAKRDAWQDWWFDAETIQAGIDRDIGRLREMGYDADVCPTDYGATASDVLLRQLAAKL